MQLTLLGTFNFEKFNDFCNCLKGGVTPKRFMVISVENKHGSSMYLSFFKLLLVN